MEWEFIWNFDIVGGIAFVLFMGYYIMQVRKEKFETRKITMIGLCAALSFILSMVVVYRMPQGGSVSLAPMVPIMLISFMFGTGAGMTTGLVYSFLTLLGGWYILTPIQALLEYVMSPMVVGLVGIANRDKKMQVLIGGASVLVLRFLIHFIAGATYFAEFADGANVWIYSLIYNGSYSLPEGIITCVVLVALPINLIMKQLASRA